MLSLMAVDISSNFHQIIFSTFQVTLSDVVLANFFIIEIASERDLGTDILTSAASLDSESPDFSKFG